MENIWNFIFYPNYLQLAWTEYTDSSLNPKDCILFLGSSPLPLSIIVLCRECDLFGVGIEQDGKKCSPFPAGNAHIKLSNSIESQQETTSACLLKTCCKLYIVAVRSEPKKEIFEHLAKVLPMGSKISYCLYEKGLWRVLDCSSFFELPGDLKNT